MASISAQSAGILRQSTERRRYILRRRIRCVSVDIVKQSGVMPFIAPSAKSVDMKNALDSRGRISK